MFGIRPERGRDGRTGRTGRTDGRTDGMDGRADGRDGRTEIQFYSTTGTEKYSFTVLLGRRNTAFKEIKKYFESKYVLTVIFFNLLNPVGIFQEISNFPEVPR